MKKYTYESALLALKSIEDSVVLIDPFREGFAARLNVNCSNSLAQELMSEVFGGSFREGVYTVRDNNKNPAVYKYRDIAESVALSEKDRIIKLFSNNQFFFTGIELNKTHSANAVFSLRR